MEWDKNIALKHIGFGKVYKPDGELIRTRDASTIIKLEDIIDEVVGACKEACIAHNQSTDYSELMAINCMRYCEMSNIYSKGYNFNIKDITRFNADSAIYTMYTYVRFNKIVSKSTALFSGMNGYEFDKYEAKLFKYILAFDSVIKKAEDTLELTPLTQYIPRICSCLCSYYESGMILGNKYEAQKVFLISKCLDIIKSLCNIMSITLLDEMK
jgi:arginyl-tRNA synthetase